MRRLSFAPSVHERRERGYGMSVTECDGRKGAVTLDGADIQEMRMQKRTEREATIGAEMPTAMTRPPREFSSGRLCRRPGCGTRLSIYNEGAFCSVHTKRPGTGKRNRIVFDAQSP
jgi:hypothetical protein